MAAASTSFPISAPASTLPVSRVRPNRCRRITPQAGRALDILAHAIEYLTDEFVQQGLEFSARNEQLQAVQLLMAVNRQIYFECPEVPPIGRRILSLLRLQAN